MANIKFVFVVRLSASQHLASDCPINLHQGIAPRAAMHPSFSRWMNSASAVNRNLQLPLSLSLKIRRRGMQKISFVVLVLNDYNVIPTPGRSLGEIPLQHFSFYGGAARREKKLRRPSARNGAEMSGERASERATGSTDGWMDVRCILPRASIDLPSSLPYIPSHKGQSPRIEV